MKKEIELNLISRLLKKIPETIKPADYIADILNMSKNHVYRRIRGINSFSFEEILKLAKELNISADELLTGKKPEHAICKLENNLSESNEDTFIRMFRYYTHDHMNIHNAKENSVTLCINHLVSLYTYPFENLFKFSYYKWLHDFGLLPFNTPLSDLVMPQSLKDMSAQCLRYRKNINITCIYDKNIIYNFIQEIKYFIDSGLINDDEIRMIKDEIKNLIEEFYIFSIYGTDKSGNNYEIYYSSLDIENNMTYIVYDEIIHSYIWTNCENYIVTYAPTLCSLQQRWLDSLKKYSVLISKSNNKMRINLYHHSMNLVDTLLK